MSPSGANMCPVYEISREDFRRPFTTWVGKVFRENPDLPMFKVRPPKGWSPRFEGGPVPIDDVTIHTPITQHAFGTRGTYRCVLVENKSMQVADFKKRAQAEENQPPKKGHEDDKLLERAFWSSITINPPVYGSDNPWSLFDKKLRWGWNLRNLGDMLQDPRVDSIPGVTTPMVYFGMWKSFFSWHTEDCDLFSINYLHTGAPKAWYCIAPSDRHKFEAMAQKEFPALYKNCKGFMRHKDLMFSPSMLRTHNVPFVQAKQEEGEFVVLNAGAYHAGFNMGFNCAEAINFAIPEWIPVGRAAVPCTCDALQDRVRIDMRLWCPDIPEPKEEVTEPEPSSSSESGEDVQQPGTPPPSQPRKRAGIASAGTGGTRKKLGKTVKNPMSSSAKSGVGGNSTGVVKRKAKATGQVSGKKPLTAHRGDGKACSRVHGCVRGKGKPTSSKGVRQQAAMPRVTKAEKRSNSKVCRGKKVDIGPTKGRVGKSAGKNAGATSRRKLSGTATRHSMPDYLQATNARDGSGTSCPKVPGRRTATSARAEGRRSLRSTVPVLPHDASLPPKHSRVPPRVRVATADRQPAPTEVGTHSVLTAPEVSGEASQLHPLLPAPVMSNQELPTTVIPSSVVPPESSCSPTMANESVCQQVLMTPENNAPSPVLPAFKPMQVVTDCGPEYMLPFPVPPRSAAVSSVDIEPVLAAFS